MIKLPPKNLRVTLSQKHLTRSRNQIRATISLEYMFHYTKWRPTDVIKKHCLPSETGFLNKMGDITPPPPTTKQTVTSYLPCAREIQAARLAKRKQQIFWSETSPKTRSFSRVPDVIRSKNRFGCRFVLFGCRRHVEMIDRGSRRHLRSPFPVRRIRKTCDKKSQKQENCPPTSFC